MQPNPLRGQVGGGWALVIKTFGPCEMASSRLGSAIWDPKKLRFPWPNPLPIAQIMDLPTSKALHTALYQSEVHRLFCIHAFLYSAFVFCILYFEHKTHNIHYRIQNKEYRTQNKNTEYRIQNTEYRIQNIENRKQNTEYRIQNTLYIKHKT